MPLSPVSKLGSPAYPSRARRTSLVKGVKRAALVGAAAALLSAGCRHRPDVLPGVPPPPQERDVQGYVVEGQPVAVDAQPAQVVQPVEVVQPLQPVEVVEPEPEPPIEEPRMAGVPPLPQE